MYPHYLPQSFNKSIAATPLTRKTMLFIKIFFEKPLDNFSFANYIIIFDNKGKLRLAFCFRKKQKTPFAKKRKRIRHCL